MADRVCLLGRRQPLGQQLKTELAAVDDGHGDNLERAKQELEKF